MRSKGQVGVYNNNNKKVKKKGNQMKKGQVGILQDRVKDNIISTPKKETPVRQKSLRNPNVSTLWVQSIRRGKRIITIPSTSA